MVNSNDLGKKKYVLKEPRPAADAKVWGASQIIFCYILGISIENEVVLPVLHGFNLVQASSMNKAGVTSAS